MGSGKSTVGEIISKKLNLLFIDMDNLIELIEEKSIDSIFRLHGEKYFRELESKVIDKIFLNKNCIFACGGGVVKNRRNVDTIRKNSTVVYLHVSPEEAYRRLENVSDRPLLKVRNRQKVIKNMINEREMLYRKNADIIVSNTDKNPEIIAYEIINKLGVNT